MRKKQTKKAILIPEQHIPSPLRKRELAIAIIIALLVAGTITYASFKTDTQAEYDSNK